MKQTVVVFSKDEFAELCKRFDEKNHFEFCPEGIEEISPNVFRYETTYRDPDNYKSPVIFTCSEGVVSWDVMYGWAEAHEEIRMLYKEIVTEMFNGEGIFIFNAEITYQPERLYCPKCGSKAAEPSNDSYHLDEERFEDNNDYLYEGRVDRFVCNACKQDFYMPELD